jgi:hypothetical protein
MSVQKLSISWWSAAENKNGKMECKNKEKKDLLYG